MCVLVVYVYVCIRCVLAMYIARVCVICVYVCLSGVCVCVYVGVYVCM